MTLTLHAEYTKYARVKRIELRRNISGGYYILQYTQGAEEKTGQYAHAIKRNKVKSLSRPG